MTLNANALVTLNQAKSYLKIPLAETSKDAHVELLINSASQYLETECDRALAKRTSLVEYLDGNGQKIIVPKQWPIISIAELRIDSESKFTDASTLVAASDYAITDDGTAILLLSGAVPIAHRAVKLTHTCAYDPVPADLQEACLWVVFWKDRIRDAQDIGRTTKNKEGESISYLQDAPKDVRDAIMRYKRTEFTTTTQSGQGW